MTIVVFLLDDSASMSQKSYVGVSYLDYARQFVECFLKLRQRDASSANDRYMLMGYDEYPKNVKSGYKERLPQFHEQLRNLRPTGRGGFAEALFNAIRFVNLNRVQTGIDNYGYGRVPSYVEPVVVIAVVDATCNSARGGNFLQNGQFPRLPAPGSECTDQPFRWDHRLFVVFLSIPGHGPHRPTKRSRTVEREQVEVVIDQMKGISFEVISQKQTIGIIENILQRIQQNGVYVCFKRDTSMDGLHSNGASLDADKLGPQYTLIYRVERSGHSNWPIPEAFWPDQSLTEFPTRRVYPEITFQTEKSVPIPMTNIKFDKYELERCPLTEAIVNAKDVNACWQVYVSNSSRTKNIGYPFGYLKLSNNMQTVNLNVFPYNYTLLFTIMEELRNEPMKRMQDFDTKVKKYFNNLPLYYVQKVLKELPALQPLLPRMPVVAYDNALVGRSKKWKEQGKEEYETTCQLITNFITPTHPDSIKVFPMVGGMPQLPMVTIVPHAYHVTPVPTKVGLLRKYQPTVPLFKNAKIAVAKTRPIANPSSKFHNPYDIQRDEIVEQLEKMRENLDSCFGKRSIALLEGGPPGKRLRLQHAEDIHSLPVGRMGDYQEYLKRMVDIGRGPLRELEPQATRVHAFGNPFKYDKKSIDVDEVSEVNDNIPAAPVVSNGTSRSSSADRNKPPKVRVLWPRSLKSPTPSPAASPRPSPSPSPFR